MGLSRWNMCESRRRYIDDMSVSKSFGCSIQRARKFVWNLNHAANMQIEDAIKKRYVARRGDDM